MRAAEELRGMGNVVTRHLDPCGRGLVKARSDSQWRGNLWSTLRGSSSRVPRVHDATYTRPVRPSARPYNASRSITTTDRAKPGSKNTHAIIAARWAHAGARLGGTPLR